MLYASSLDVLMPGEAFRGKELLFLPLYSWSLCEMV